MSRASAKDMRERVAALEARASEADAQVASLERELRLLRYRGDQDELELLEGALRAAGELITAETEPGRSVGILGGGRHATVRLSGRTVTRLDPGGTGDPPASGAARLASAMALVESARVHGVRYLLVPGPPLGGTEPEGGLREYLLDRYQLLADDTEFGMLLDLGAGRNGTADSPSTVASALELVSGGDRHLPVLDWTRLDLGSELTDRTFFSPPGPDGSGTLPYLDASVPVVVVDDPARVDEARRVASTATIGARRDGEGRLALADVDAFGVAAASRSFEVLLDSESEDWLERLSGALASRPDTVVRAVADPAAAGASTADIVVVVEGGVLPLPGCLEAIAITLEEDATVGSVAAKLMEADGSLAAAGTMIFNDGSVAGIGAFSSDAAAPWHETTRPICAGAGLLALRPSLVRDSAASGRRTLAGLAAGVWQAGLEVRYQPDAWAVRTSATAAGGEGEGEVAEGWQDVLGTRPHRPTRLDARAWRSLLMRDDVAESWR